LVVGLTPQLVLAGYQYAGQRTAQTVNGLSGTIWTNLLTLRDPSHEHVNHSFSLGPSGQWAQVGVYQGSVGGSSSPSSVRMYTEWIDTCGYYNFDDIGSAGNPPNYVWFQVNYTGSYTSAYCGGSYLWAYRVGLATNPPVRTSYMSVNAAPPDAFTEHYFESARSALRVQTLGRRPH
jgi:hypothetical protein